MDYKDEILQEKFKQIKEIHGTDDFETTFELLKEIVNELRENFNEVLKNKDKDINSLLSAIETLVV
ncbi:12276_t:CDS:2 [Racocetra persica]|uniref:12276_t:CDS:1 n=1 Tax=Racocetra persica TaxID=160502 RepID=A0ACA9NBT0_9GLOM|nr:12276_t:CDS:2 [Racocetra persica]